MITTQITPHTLKSKLQEANPKEREKKEEANAKINLFRSREREKNIDINVHFTLRPCLATTVS